MILFSKSTLRHREKTDRGEIFTHKYLKKRDMSVNKTLLKGMYYSHFGNGVHNGVHTAIFITLWWFLYNYSKVDSIG